MNTMHVKKGDTVTVLAGNEKGKSGKVVAVFPKRDLVLVDGIGMRKKHQKSRREGQKGQIIDKHFPVHASNVQLQDKKNVSKKEKGSKKKESK